MHWGNISISYIPAMALQPTIHHYNQIEERPRALLPPSLPRLAHCAYWLARQYKVPQCFPHWLTYCLRKKRSRAACNWEDLPNFTGVIITCVTFVWVCSCYCSAPWRKEDSRSRVSRGVSSCWSGTSNAVKQRCYKCWPRTATQRYVKTAFR